MTETWFVGVDWGSQTHHVCVLDRDGLRTDPQCLRRRQAPNDAIVKLRELSRARKQLVDQKNHGRPRHPALGGR